MKTRYLIVLLLSSLLLLIPLPAIAQEPVDDLPQAASGANGGQPGTVPPAMRAVVEGVAVGEEVKALRTANSQHIYLGHNRFEARISAGPIHYRDAQGNWQKIDTTLHPHGGHTFAAEAHSLQSYLPARSNETVQVGGTIYPRPEPHPSSSFAEMNYSKEEVLRQFPETNTETLPPVSTSLTWTPAVWRYADTAGHLDELAAPHPVTGQVHENTILYQDVMPNVNETYRVIPGGLKHELTLLTPLRPPADHLTGPVFFEYVSIVNLPDGLVLYADGQPQPGDFTTAGPIEVRDSAGHYLLELTGPLAYEADNPAITVKGSYALWRQDGLLYLAWRTPLAWLLAPERHYPVVLDPTSIHAYSDATLDSENPDTADSNFSVGHLETLYARTLRAVLQWDISSIPDYAFINSVKVYLLQSYSMSSTYVDVHRVTSFWQESYVTWNKRSSSSYWDSAGGDYDSTVLDHNYVNSTLDWKIWESQKLRNLVAMWNNDALYRTFTGASYGERNYGLLFKYASETGTSRKIFYDGESSNTYQRPALTIDYTVGPSSLNKGLAHQDQMPSPDYYSMAGTSNAEWQVVSIQPIATGVDYDLYFYDSYPSSPSAYDERSIQGTDKVDFVVVDPLAGAITRYPVVVQFEGTADYSIEYSDELMRITELDPNGITASMDGDTSTRIWGLEATGGQSYCVLVQPTGGSSSARLGVAIFQPENSYNWNPDYYQPRNDALSSALAVAAGQSVQLQFEAPVSGNYGLVVWNETPMTHVYFHIKGCSGGSVYLPFIFKN